jgi:hypothetical protein
MAGRQLGRYAEARRPIEGGSAGIRLFCDNFYPYLVAFPWLPESAKMRTAFGYCEECYTGGRRGVAPWEWVLAVARNRLTWVLGLMERALNTVPEVAASGSDATVMGVCVRQGRHGLP